MDESYVSSDHSGYVRLPSPVDGGLDPNVLPLRHRGSLGEHQPIPIPSSLLQTKHDCGDDDCIPIPETNKIDSDFIRASRLWMETCSKIHGLGNPYDPNSQKRESGNVLGSLLAQDGLKQNIDPEENHMGGKIAAGCRSELTLKPCNDDRLPKPSVVKKYPTRVLADDEGSIECTVTEAEEKAKDLSEELQALEAKVTEKETHIRQLILDKDELSKKINDLEGRVDALEGDKLSLERQVKDTNCVKEIPKTHPLEEDEQTQSIEEEILGFRRQLDEENEHFYGVEMETLSLQKRIAELEETRADQEKSKEDLESRIRLMQTLEKEIRLFESRLADLEAAKNEIASKDLQPHLHSRSVEEQLRIVNAQHRASTATMNRIQQTIFNTKLATGKVTNEMKSLKNGLDKATQESKASRIRMAQLSRATAEKVAKWEPLRHADDIKSRRQIAAFDNLLSEIDYTAMIREVHQGIIGS